MTEHSAITLRIVPHIVASKEAWERTKKDGWRLKIGKVNDELQKAREALFYDEVYFPKMKRILQWMRALDVMPDADWQWLDMGYNKDIGMWYPNDIECQEWLDLTLQDYFTELYSNDDWFFEDLKAEEIWEFCKKPEFVQENAPLVQVGTIEPRVKAKAKKKRVAKPKVQQSKLF